MRVITEGWWCLKCEFFEAEDDIDTTLETCRACGCEGSVHIPVEIATKGLEMITYDQED